MSETELKALISLLDDEDPNIEEHVKDKLVSMGDEVIPRLEQAWESQKDELVQNRIEEIIHVIQTKGTIDGLKTWREQGGNSLLRGWYLVTQYQYPELDFLTFKNSINRLIHKIWLEIRTGMEIPEKLLVINRMLFSRERFRSNRKNHYDPNNYYLNGLIETKKGGPISLGILYLIICQELDIDIQGIILPGYFALTYQDRANEIYIDIFNKGAFFARNDLNRFLKEMKVEEDEKYYQPSTQVQIILNLIEVLIKCYQKQDNGEKQRAFEYLLNAVNSKNND